MKPLPPGSADMRAPTRRTLLAAALLLAPLGPACDGGGGSGEGDGEGEGEGEGGDGGGGGAEGEEGEGEAEPGAEGEGEGEGEGEPGAEGEAGEGEGEGEGGEGEGEGEGEGAFRCDDRHPCRGTDVCIHGACIACGCQADRDCAEGKVCEECACIPRCAVHTDCLPGERCDDRGRCRVRDWCERNSECPDGQACVDRACVEPAAENTCAGAIRLDSGVPAAGSTRRAIDRTSGSCSARPSPEVVFTFDVDEPSGVRVLVDGSADRFDAVVYLRTNCGGDAGAEEVACSDKPFTFVEQLEVEQVQPGTYHLFVESFREDAQGDFEVVVEVTPGQICVGDASEPNDRAAQPADLWLANGRDLHLCPGDEDWFSVNLSVGDEVVVAATADTPGAADGLAVRLRTAAGAPVPGELARVGARVELRVARIDSGGQHLVQVDHVADAARVGYRLDAEVFTLNGTCDCTNPTTLRPNAAAVAGDTGECGHETAGTCRSAIRHTAPEVPYKFHLDDWASVRVEVIADFDYINYVRRACRGEAVENELSCQAADDIDLAAVPPGTYYLYVDGRRDESGPYTVRVVTGPPNFPPDNNTCARAAEILVGQTVEGDTTFATNTFRSSRQDDACQTSPFGHTSPDLVYWFDLAAPTRVRAVLRANGWEGMVYVREECEQESSQVMCGQVLQIGDLPVAEGDLSAGRHFLIVDGFRAGRGAFSLELTEL